MLQSCKNCSGSGYVRKYNYYSAKGISGLEEKDIMGIDYDNSYSMGEKINVPCPVCLGQAVYNYKLEVKYKYEIVSDKELKEHIVNSIVCNNAYVFHSIYTCDECSGSGMTKDAFNKPCFKCGGKGVVKEVSISTESRDPVTDSELASFGIMQILKEKKILENRPKEELYD